MRNINLNKRWKLNVDLVNARADMDGSTTVTKNATVILFAGFILSTNMEVNKNKIFAIISQPNGQYSGHRFHFDLCSVRHVTLSWNGMTLTSYVLHAPRKVWCIQMNWCFCGDVLSMKKHWCIRNWTKISYNNILLCTFPWKSIDVL